jgi:hypothetical protein
VNGYAILARGGFDANVPAAHVMRDGFHRTFQRIAKARPPPICNSTTASAAEIRITRPAPQSNVSLP